MKKTDIAMIILIASVSVMAAYLIAGSLPMFRDVNKPVKVKVATPINTSVEKPDPDLFNSNAINPTVEVIIGGPSQPDSTAEEDSSNSTDEQPESTQQDE